MKYKIYFTTLRQEFFEIIDLLDTAGLKFFYIGGPSVTVILKKPLIISFNTLEDKILAKIILKDFTYA